MKKALKDLLSISSLLQLFLCSPIVCCHMSGRLCEDCSPTYAFSRRQGILHGPVKLCIILASLNTGVIPSGSAGDLTCTRPAFDKTLELYNLSDTPFNLSREAFFIIIHIFFPSGSVFSPSSIRIASSSGQIVHLLGQDITWGRDNKHLISGKLMVTGSLLTFLPGL